MVVAWLSTKPVRWNPVLLALVAAASAAVAVAATVVVAALAAAAVVVTAVVVAVVTAVAVAATKHLLLGSDFGLTTKGPSGPFCFCYVVQTLLLRGLRGRPAKALSNRALGSRRSTLATTPICQGITR